ncbi:O-linked N-acetylglucosamine transferase family protein, partial [Roseateles sp. GG27B]
FDVWCDLLQQLPDAVLWLLQWNDTAPVQLRLEAQARGIDPARLVFAPKVGVREHLSRLALADLFIDTWPCNGHTTASDALWAGVPVITYAGENFASRVAASLLQAVGLPQLACNNLDDYRDLVLKLAGDAPARQALHEHLLLARDQAPLFDSDRYTKDFGNLLWRMAERWSQGLPPEHLDAALPISPAPQAEMQRLEIGADADAKAVAVAVAVAAAAESTDYEDPAMSVSLPEVHLCIVQPGAFVHSLGFLDQARYFRHQFRRMGANVSVAKNRLRHDAVNFVFGAHLGFDAHRCERYSCVFVNLEQLGRAGRRCHPITSNCWLLRLWWTMTPATSLHHSFGRRAAVPAAVCAFWRRRMAWRLSRPIALYWQPEPAPPRPDRSHRGAGPESQSVRCAALRPRT